jgi:uncharacterized protein
MNTNNNKYYLHPRVLRLNVGFILSEGSGFSRDMTIEFPEGVRVADDLVVEEMVGSLRLTRTSEGVLLQGSVEVVTPTVCTRCLDEIDAVFSVPLEEMYTIHAGHVEHPFTIGEDAILDLAPLLREEIITNVPKQILCSDNCLGLCPECGQNLNESGCDCAENTIDPRWAALAKLQEQLEDNS